MSGHNESPVNFAFTHLKNPVKVIRNFDVNFFKLFKFVSEKSIKNDRCHKFLYAKDLLSEIISIYYSQKN